MPRTMPLPVETQVPDNVVLAYCERCGEEVTGLCACDDLPIAYRYGVCRLFAGTCERCRDRRSGRERDGPADLH
jgi:hypothetical protein